MLLYHGMIIDLVKIHIAAAPGGALTEPGPKRKATMDILRLGVIGTGSVVREIYQYLYFRSAYSPLMRIEAICDTNQEMLSWFGDTWKIPSAKRFTSYTEMLKRVELDAVAVNTPDSLHRNPTIAALEAGLDVLLPKPTADKVADAHAIIEAVRSSGRFLGVDFHKREDPVTKEARGRYAAGVYGRLQSAVMYMLDRLLVSNPNHKPRFFASADFAEKNTPVSFLTSHMADTFIHITRLRPLEIRAVGYKQKLPSLSPISVNGYDLIDTEILFEEGVLCHIISGWALPNPANGLTVQTARFLFSDCMLDLWQEHYGYHEVTAEGIDDRNILFRNFEVNGMVSGFGMDCPGKIISSMLRFRNGKIDAAEKEDLFSPFSLGLYTTLVCECAHESLAKGTDLGSGVVRGASVDARGLLGQRIGGAAQQYYR
jgi:predicted dehydrogenase